MICTVACQETEVVRFLGSFHLCLFLNYFNQATKSNLSKKLLSNLESKTKDKFLTTRLIFFFINNKFQRSFNSGAQARQVEMWGGGRGGFPPVFENQKKCPGFGKKNPDFSFKLQSEEYLGGKPPKLFPAGSFFCFFLMKYFSKYSDSTKLSLS